MVIVSNMTMLLKDRTIFPSPAMQTAGLLSWYVPGLGWKDLKNQFKDSFLNVKSL